MTPPASGRAFRLRLSALLFHLSGSASARRFQETPSVYAGFRAGGAAANSRWWSTATPPERHHRKGLHAGGVLGLCAPGMGAEQAVNVEREGKSSWGPKGGNPTPKGQGHGA